jgi:hypothetical protein
MHHFDWFAKQQADKKQAMEESQISNINHQLRQLIMGLPGTIAKEKYDSITNEARKFLVQSTLWNLSYRNNFENPQVAVAQAILIVKVAKDENLDNKRYLIDQADRFMGQLGHIDWNMRIKYNQMKSTL